LIDILTAKRFNGMSTTSSMLQRIRVTIGRVFAAIAPKRRAARRATPEPNEDPGSRSPRSSISDVVVFEPTRRAEIERLLSQTRTPETTVSFLRGVTALSVPVRA
jgi:hypothetical protein